MKRIIFATENEGKMKEVRMILKGPDCEVCSLKDLKLEAKIVEDGASFEENAMIKARTVMELTGEIVLGDDSGLEVDYLNQEPGIYSARYLGRDTPYAVKNQYIIDRLAEAEGGERSARFVCAIACAFPDGRSVTTKGILEGLIGYEIRGANGFGYDPIFWLPQYKCTSAELKPEEKNRISHRGKALQAMKELLEADQAWRRP